MIIAVCGQINCLRSNKCPTNRQKCKKMNYFDKVCRSGHNNLLQNSLGQISNKEDKESDSDNPLRRILVSNLEDAKNLKGDPLRSTFAC